MVFIYNPAIGKDSLVYSWRTKTLQLAQICFIVSRILVNSGQRISQGEICE